MFFIGCCFIFTIFVETKLITMKEAAEQYERIVNSIIDSDKLEQLESTKKWIANFGVAYNNEDAMKNLLAMVQYKRRCVILGIGQIF